MKSHVDIIIAAALLLALLNAAPFSSGAQRQHIKGRALLVGINHYRHAPDVPPTRGAEEDAKATAELIQRQYGFRSDEIKLLLGAEATAENIIAEFRRWLIEDTMPGDRVFFLYAGHGSWLPDDNGDEDDGRDETLAPYDVTTSGEHMIRDDLIGELIAQLSGRLAALVFDSCHSGTISRAVGGGKNIASDARYLPSPEEFKQLKLASARGGGKAGYEAHDEPGDGRILRKRDLKLVDEHSVGPAVGIVVISGAGAGQVAHALEVNGGKRGALSYVFGEAQRGRDLTLIQLRDEVKSRIAALQHEGRLPGRQEPEFEVISTVALDNQPLFGAPLAAPAVALANPQSTVKLSLRTRESKTVYRFGETVSYHFTTDTPGYLYLIVFSERDVATCIFPNAILGDNWLKAGGHVITRDGREGFYVGEPEGKDVAVALLSATKLDLGGKREEYSWSEVFGLLRNRRFSEYVKTRGQTSHKPAELTNWQAVSLVLEAVR